jgi:hypothetical protein
MKRMTSGLAALLLLGTIGVGAVSADPINKNSRYLTVNCEGEILDLVTQSGAGSQILGDTRVAVLQGLRDGDVWIYPITKGLVGSPDLLECPYVTQFGTHDYVAYLTISGQP